MTTRREFTQALAAAAVLTPRWRDALAFAEKPRHLGPLGVQLYSLRDSARRDIEGTLARIRGIGYRQVEWWGSFGRTPAQIRAALDADGLTSPSAHVGLDALTTGLDVTLEAAERMGHKWLVFPGLDAEDHRPERYDEVADLLNAAGERAHRHGIRVGYHNHDVDLHPWADGEIPLERLARRLDPRVADLEVDLYWITKGGGDPKQWLRDHPGRIPLVHVKDAGPAPDFVMSDVGAGAIDWHALFQLRQRAGIKHYYVEHDEPVDPWASITASFRYLSHLSV